MGDTARKLDDLVKGAPDKEKARQGEPAATENTGARILVVDDSRALRVVLRRTLEEGGFTVVEAKDGEEGLETAQAGSFDLVITDINMPRRDGIELVRALRDLDEYKTKPILILSTESTMRAGERGRTAGATGWIVKPFTEEKVRLAVTRILDRQVKRT